MSKLYPKTAPARMMRAIITINIERGTLVRSKGTMVESLAPPVVHVSICRKLFGIDPKSIIQQPRCAISNKLAGALSLEGSEKTF